MYNLFTEQSKKQSYMQSAFLLSASSRDPQKPVLCMPFPDESIQNVGEPDSRKPFSLTSSEHSPHPAGLSSHHRPNGNVNVV
ncbi:hypothetical protein TNCV_2924601 [Trichonephila clavipes]|nr:hypothetical protein TNCV_2924601 [Trichonephila clavipes]